MMDEKSKMENII